MTKFNQKDVDIMFAKVNNGIWEYKKAKVTNMIKTLLVGIWTITVFPLILFWMFLTDEL